MYVSPWFVPLYFIIIFTSGSHSVWSNLEQYADPRKALLLFHYTHSVRYIVVGHLMRIDLIKFDDLTLKLCRIYDCIGGPNGIPSP